VVAMRDWMDIASYKKGIWYEWPFVGGGGRGGGRAWQWLGHGALLGAVPEGWPGVADPSSTLHVLPAGGGGPAAAAAATVYRLHRGGPERR